MDLDSGTLPGDCPDIRGARRIDFMRHIDARGELGVFELGDAVDFVIRRVFYLRVDSAETVRAEHANSSVEIIVALTGAATVDLDNGDEQQSVRLSQSSEALFIDAGVWHRLRDFQPGTVLMVLTDQLFADTRYFDRPCLVAAG